MRSLREQGEQAEQAVSELPGCISTYEELGITLLTLLSKRLQPRWRMACSRSGEVFAEVPCY